MGATLTELSKRPELSPSGYRTGLAAEDLNRTGYVAVFSRGVALPPDVKRGLRQGPSAGPSPGPVSSISGLALRLVSIHI